MGYKVFACMDIAIVGASRTSITFAEKLFEVGHHVFVSAIDLEEEKEIKNYFSYNDSITFCTLEDAALAADIIIIATNPAHMREVAYRIDDVRDKVVIDATEILASNSGSGVNTLNAARAITGSQHIVKCFNCKEYDNALHAFYKDHSIDIFIAGDSKKAKATIQLLARDLGYADCYDFGGNETVPVLEDMARCMMNFAKHEYAAQMDLKLLEK